jgi:hypothetical protein
MKKNVKIKEIPNTDICMEGSKETSRGSSEKGIETKMVLCTDIHLEGSKKITRSLGKIDVKTKETLSSDTQPVDSQEPNRCPSKKRGWNKRGLKQGYFNKRRSKYRYPLGSQ